MSEETSRISFVLKLTVFEVRNIPTENNSSSDISVGYSAECFFGDYSLLKTQISWKDAPFWGDDAVSDIDGTEELTVTVTRFKKRRGVLGALHHSDKGKLFATKTIPLINFKKNKVIEDWFKFFHKGEEFCEIRLKFSLEEFIVLPTNKFNKLNTFLLDDPKFSILTVLSSSSKVDPDHKTLLGELLCQISHSKGKDIEILKHVLATEILNTQTEEVLFRGNSVGTKAFDFYLKMMGGKWLSLLNPLIREIASHEEVRCELAQNSVEEGEDIEKNLTNLTNFVNFALNIIFSPEARTYCPPSVREILKAIRITSGRKFPDGNAMYISLTSFIFLRFWVAAIRTPKLFNLSDILYEGNIRRNLTLVGSVLQKLANFSDFEAREAHMNLMNPLLSANTNRLKSMLEELSSGAGDSIETQYQPYDLGLAFSKLIPLLRTYTSLIDENKDIPNLKAFWNEVQVIETALKESNAKVVNISRASLTPQDRKKNRTSVGAENNSVLTPGTKKRTRGSKSLSVSDKIDSLKNKILQDPPPTQAKSAEAVSKKINPSAVLSIKVHFPNFNTKLIPLSSAELAGTPFLKTFSELCAQCGISVDTCSITDAKTGAPLCFSTTLNQMPLEINVSISLPTSPQNSNNTPATTTRTAPIRISSNTPNTGTNAVLKAFENSARPTSPMGFPSNYQYQMMYSGFGVPTIPGTMGMGMGMDMQGMYMAQGMGPMNTMNMNMGMNSMDPMVYMQGNQGLHPMARGMNTMDSMQGMYLQSPQGIHPIQGIYLQQGMMSPQTSMLGTSPNFNTMNQPFNPLSTMNVSSPAVPHVVPNAAGIPTLNLPANASTNSPIATHQISPRGIELKKIEPGFCAECNKEITEQQKPTALNLLGKEYHNTCFKCSKCNTPVGPTSHKIGNKFITCHPCFEDLVAQQQARTS